MEAKYWRVYRQMFNCVVSMAEPMGNYCLLDRETDKLYRLDAFPTKDIERMIEKSVESESNILLDASRNYEIPRCYEVDPNKIL